MKIYVSGSFAAQANLRDRADILRQMGHEITSTWLYEVARPAHLNAIEWNHALATKDIAELFSSDCIIMDVEAASTTGGMFVEWGIACYPGSLRRRYIVGKHDGVFSSLAHRKFAGWADAFAYFRINHDPRGSK